MTRKEIEDTVIAVEQGSAYIAKIIKGNKAISEVRREITKDEICGLIDWFLDNRLEKDNETIYFESQ